MDRINNNMPEHPRQVKLSFLTFPCSELSYWRREIPNYLEAPLPEQAVNGLNLVPALGGRHLGQVRGTFLAS